MDLGAITIRQAGESDTEVVSSILLEVARWLRDRGMPLWKDDELLPERIRAEVAAGLFWLAEAGGGAAGCVRFQTEDALFWPDMPAGESGFIHRLAVRRDAAGGAVSAAMLEWAKAHAARLGKRYLRLDTDATKAKLCAIYERNGFRRHSERQVGPYMVIRYECELGYLDVGPSRKVST